MFAHVRSESSVNQMEVSSVSLAANAVVSGAGAETGFIGHSPLTTAPEDPWHERIERGNSPQLCKVPHLTAVCRWLYAPGRVTSDLA